MLPHLTGAERELFHSGREAFSRLISVQGDAFEANTELGLGPAFNGDSCAMCHAYPALGGSSPALNPQLESARRLGARNRIPAFLQINGPVLQARFLRDDAGRPDGSVHPFFTIAGRRDAPLCDAAQPDFDAEAAQHNLSFRIPTPLFGDGFIEAIPDAAIEENAASHAAEKNALGIAGLPNRSAQDGSIGRYGWKAELASLESFAAQAYAVEEGVTNELFPQERQGAALNCRFNATPEDKFLPFSRRPVDSLSNVSRVAYFLRFLAPPPPPASSAESEIGKQLFNSTGCALCHTPSLLTGKSSLAALSEQFVPLYSDLLLHHMGSSLADHIQAGLAGPDQFRTPPLWGVGHRLFFLHDGRARDLSDAILMHAAAQDRLRSEAAQVVARYRSLSPQDRDALLSFLRSL